MSKSPYRADNSCAAGTDTVFLKKLQLKNGVDAPDIWGSEKNQPAVASIHLILRDGFGSAASIDALDHNTIHYGQLAKHVQSKCSKVAKLQEVFDAIKSEIVGMARRADGSSKVAYTAIELTLPKASMYGEGVGIISTLKLDGNGHLSLLQRNFVLMDLKIMVLIGVNDNERTKKQPVMVNLDMTLREAHESLLEAHNGILFAVESKLVKEIIENTSFETLEALAIFTFDKLLVELRDTDLPCSLMKLRLEKPHAVRDAHAPGVEITRPLAISESDSKHTHSALATREVAQLRPQFRIVKPYV